MRSLTQEQPITTPWRTTTVVIATAAVVGLVLWAIARLLGIELTVERGQDLSQVGAMDVVLATVVAGVAARMVHMLLARRPRTARWWPSIGSTALSLSIVGPWWMADGAAVVALSVMHLAVGAVLIAGFARIAPRWY